jgi:hypothetical protein
MPARVCDAIDRVVEESQQRPGSPVDVGRMKRHNALSVPLFPLFLPLGALLAVANLGACSSGVGDPSSNSSSAPVTATSLQGAWRICDANVQSNPGSAYYIGNGGTVVELTAQGDVLSADYQYTDGGTSFDGTYHFLSGSYDSTARVWTPDLYDNGEAPDGAAMENDFSGDIALTFDATGTRFIGTGLGDGDEESWYGGREDGSFTCGQSPSGTASPTCSGTPRDCEDQEPGSCVNGCNLILGVYPMPNSCGGLPDPCDQLGVEDLCAQAGCQWGTPGDSVDDGDAGVAVEDGASAAPAHSCQGTPPVCAGQGEGECARGCLWLEKCGGGWEGGVPCTDFSADQCDQEPGCRTSGACSGTTWPCSFEDDETTCTQTPGCSWQ